MATWQFDLDLLPRKQLLTMFGKVPSFLNGDTLDAASTWTEQLLPTDCGSRISKFLPEDKSWSPEIRMWGEEDGNRVSVVHNDAGYPDSISIRLDARDPNNELFKRLVEFAKSIDAVFLILEDLQVFEPRADLLEMRMNQSNASRFVEDPQEFFERIRSGRTKIRNTP